jgi:hypothetical protein
VSKTEITTTLLANAVSLFSGGQPIDLIDLASVKLELQITETADDAWLASVITRASQKASNYCNRVFQPQLWQDQIWPDRDSYPWQLPPRLRPLQLSQFPLLSTPSPCGTAPPLAPGLAVAAGGALAAATYYARISYVTAAGETAASQETALTLAADQLLVVAAPKADNFQTATGWNVYVGAASYGETKQNAAPIAMGTSWTLPTSGLITGAAVPNYLLVVENAPLFPTPLCEGSDFLANPTLGQLTRRFAIDEQPKSWGLPVVAIYRAQYAAIPSDIQDAMILLVKARWFGRMRDPMIRSQNAEGIYEATYWFATGPGGPGDLPVDVASILDRYRVPVVA